MPSRSRFEDFKHCCNLLFEKAAEPSKVEVVVRLDSDDLTVYDYLNFIMEQSFFKYFYLIGSRGNGYADNWKMIDMCARAAIGDVIIQYNDDMEMMSKDWDLKYREALKNNPYSVASAKITTPEEGKHNGFRFSCPAISRKLYNILGGIFSLGSNPSVDRCWEAYARYSGFEVKTDVEIFHKHLGTGDKLSVESRNEFYDILRDNLDIRKQEWNFIGKKYAEMVHELIMEG